MSQIANKPLESSSTLSKLELVCFVDGPILASLLLQIPTDTIFQLYHTSSYLRQFLRGYPTAWRYLSFRLLQPSSTTPSSTIVTTNANGTTTSRQSRNYALDQLMITVVNPFSTCLTSLELDNTAISGTILTSTVLNPTTSDFGASLGSRMQECFTQVPYRAMARSLWSCKRL